MREQFKIQDVFLALAALASELTCAVLCAVTVLQRQSLLPAWLEMIYLFLGGILGLFFFAIYFCLLDPGETKNTDKIKRRWADVLQALLWLATVCCTWMFLGRISEILRGSLLSNETAYITVQSLLALAAAFAFSLFLPGLFLACGLDPGKGFVRRLLLFGMTVLAAGILAGASFLWNRLSGMSGPSVVSMLGRHVFLALCEYAIVRLAAAFCRRSQALLVYDSAAQKPQTRRRIWGMTVPAVLAVLFFLFTGIRFPSGSVVKQSAAAVETAVNDGYAALEEGNLEKAISCFMQAEARAYAFRSLVSEEAERSLRAVYLENQDDAVIGALYLSDQGNMTYLEQEIRNDTRGSQWYPILLRYYEEQVRDAEKEQPPEDILSEEQRNLRKELLHWYVAREQYTGKECIFAQDLEGSRLAVLKQMQEYEGEFAACSLFRIMAQYGSEGGYSKELVNQALQMSEEQPDNILLQYAAYQIGSSYQEDSASHYGRTAEAAVRFDRLYDDGTKTEEQIAREKKNIADAALRCYQYETALTFYEAAYELSEDASCALACAKIYDKTEEYAKCAGMAQDVLEAEPENGQALYLLAVSCLKTGDTDGALEAAGRLGDLVADPNRQVSVAEENWLYVCAQYMAMKDSSSWTDYTWQIYNSLSEEQIALAQSHALLWDYMTAVFQCFMAKDYEAAQEAAQRILAVRGDLPMAWYLKGTICFNKKEFEEALDDFEQAVDCKGEAPAIYFSIANVYDAMEDYENAWLYARRVEEMLPYQDHGNDVYGISVHNRNLLKAVEKKLGR